MKEEPSFPSVLELSRFVTSWALSTKFPKAPFPKAHDGFHKLQTLEMLVRRHAIALDAAGREGGREGQALAAGRWEWREAAWSEQGLERSMMDAPRCRMQGVPHAVRQPV